MGLVRVDETPFRRCCSHGAKIISPTSAIPLTQSRKVCAFITRSSPPDSTKNVVLVCKKTRWEVESARHICNGKKADAAVLLEKRGVDGATIKEKHMAQKKVEEDIINDLSSRGFSVTMVKLSSLPPTLPPAHFVLAAGGDGTFLAAASLITDATPVIGINTDPHGSEGHLCAGGKTPPPDLINRILSPHTEWNIRSRLKVTMKGAKGRKDSKPLLALNEVFVGEVDSAKVSYYDISIDDSPPQRQKSSGIVVCTGSGSSAWYTSMNRVQSHTVSSVVQSLRSLGITIPEDNSFITTVAESINSQLSVPPHCPDLLFSVREAIFNNTFHPSPTKGRATKVTLKSRCSDACIVLDGSRKYTWEYGSEITIEIDSNYALHTLF